MEKKGFVFRRNGVCFCGKRRGNHTCEKKGKGVPAPKNKTIGKEEGGKKGKHTQPQRSPLQEPYLNFPCTVGIAAR